MISDFDAPAKMVFHVGFHRTGTTTLQRHFFPALPHCTTVTRENEHGAIFTLLSRNLCDADERRYLRSTVAAYLEEVSSPTGVLLVSDENLSGALWGRSRNRRRNADRLHALCPTARILVTIRNQRSMLRSLYDRNVLIGGYARFGDFVAGRAEHCDFDLDHLRYDDLVECYQTLFGPDRVRVVPYELFLADAATYLGQLASFILDKPLPRWETPLPVENRSPSAASKVFLRHANRMFRRSIYNARPRVLPLHRSYLFRPFAEKVIDPVLPNRDMPPADMALLDQLAQRYQQGNAKLERLAGLDLARWGYPLPGASGGS